MKYKYWYLLAIVCLLPMGCQESSNSGSMVISDRQPSHSDDVDDEKVENDKPDSSDKNDKPGVSDDKDNQDNSGSSEGDKKPGASDDKEQDPETGNDDKEQDPGLDPSIPRDVEGGLVSWLEEFTCDDDSLLCDSNYAVECKDQHYYIHQNCSEEPVNNRCIDFKGCLACEPDSSFCDGKAAYHCSSDGLQKELVRTCTADCIDGQCLEEDNCSAESKFIYLVSPSYHLIKFDPGDPTKEYETLLFKLNCSSTATPWSMAVDRNAMAWVMYSDASMYKVNIKTQECSLIKKFDISESGIMAMGFCSDEPGSEKETLYFSERISKRFSKLNPETLEYTPMKKFPSYYAMNPEMTGSGLGKLIAFAPGSTNQYISEIDKNTGDVLVEYQLPGVPTASYAVAHWGGYYFTFLGNRIYRFDPKTEEFITFLENAPFQVIGAGVSTCAPVTVVN